MATTLHDTLVEEYEAWLKEQGPAFDKAGCAMELMYEPHINMVQRMWLADFINRWDAMEDAEREARENDTTNMPDDGQTYGGYQDRQILDAGDTVILERRCWHGNLILQVVHNVPFDIYAVQIYRDNTREQFAPWGIFNDRDDAIAKFNQVEV